MPSALQRSCGQPPQSHSSFEERRTIRHGTAPSQQHDARAFRVAAHPRREVVRVAAAGELDLASAGVLAAQLSELRDAGFRHVELDLRELTFIDCAGVRLILGEDQLASRSGQRLSMIRGAATVERVLDLCGVADLIDFDEPAQHAPSTRQQHAPRIAAG